MDITQLQQGIAAKFGIGPDEGCRLLFWYDPEQSFRDTLAELDVPDVTVLDMTGASLFETKKRIERDEPQRRFLLYFPYAEPSPDNDWFLDVRLYSEQFFADASSMLLAELGIRQMALRSHIHKRQSFFANKQRVAAVRRFITENEDEVSLDRKMLAVVVKADSASLTDSVLSLLREYAISLATDGNESVLMESLEKFELTPALWHGLEETFSYHAREPSLWDFILKLFCTELWSQLDGGDRDWLLGNVLKAPSGRATAVAFMASWRDSRSYSGFHDCLSEMLAQKLEIAQRVSRHFPQQLAECMGFEAVEQAIIRGLVNDLTDNSRRVDRVQFDTLLSRRLPGHWCLSRKEYTAIYNALRHAELLMELRQQYVDGFHFDSCKAMYLAYTDKLYLFDQAYRLFNEQALTLASKGAEILRQLENVVESLYTDWYLYESSTAWERLLEKEQRLQQWHLSGISNQYRFYDEQVSRRLHSTQTKRIFVIVSDALRYEIAEELAGVINREKRFHAELSSQLGVLPSYTPLGMAALLPHKTLTYQFQSDNPVVWVDGKSSAGLDNRKAILEGVNGMAVSAKELMTWSNQDGRDAVKDCQVVYIYHDTIDAICDKQAGEDRTPQVCRDAIIELKNLMARVINRLNASHVLVTADHGFLYQQKALQKSDKTGLAFTPDRVIEAKKRYILGENLPVEEHYWKGKISDSAAANTSLEFMLPKGVQRFNFIGGARFVHGGAMLQEICVPVLHIKVLQKEQAAKLEKQQVGVVAAGLPIKLVNNIDKVRFIQTDAVGEQFLPRRLDIYIVDDQYNIVSSRETLNFDSRSPVMDQRIRDVRIKLIGASFDRLARYSLILEDSEIKTQYQHYAVTIDLAFQDDFF